MMCFWAIHTILS